jgi:hypothetical protein
LDRGLPTAQEEPDEVEFHPALLLRFKAVSDIAVTRDDDDPEEDDIYQIQDLRYEPEAGWVLTGWPPTVNLILGHADPEVELYRL